MEPGCKNEGVEGQGTRTLNGGVRGAMHRRSVPLTSSNRLPSFRPPRDLTLSSMALGVSPGAKPKRVFTPNIPSRRDRSRPTE